MAWVFTIDPLREGLRCTRSAEDLIAHIADTLQIVCSHHQPPHNGPDELRRLVYTIMVGSTVFDQFFNAETRYRGWYFESAEHGMAMNRRLIGALTPALISSGGPPGVSREEVAAGLAGLSAKVWLAEAGNHIDRGCRFCEGECPGPQGDTADILNGRWELPCTSEHAWKTRWGRHAPHGTQLRVFGAFLNRAREEWVPASKLRRAEDIHRFGWS